MLLEILPKSHQDFALLKYVLKNADSEGFLKVEYRHGKGLNFGRVYANKGLQSCTGEVRARCAKAQELDQVNSHPTILAQIFDRHGLTHGALKRYNLDRETIIAEICRDHEQWNRKDVKRLFLICQFLGRYRRHSEGVKVAFLDQFEQEMHRNVAELEKCMPEMSTYIAVAQGMRRPRVLATAISYLCQTEEHRIMEFACEFVEKTHEVYTDRHDGCLFELGGSVDLALLSDHVFEQTGYRIQFTVKQLVPATPPPDLFPRTCDDTKRNVLFDVEATLLWGCGKKAVMRPDVHELKRLQDNGFRVGLYSSNAQRRIPIKPLLDKIGIEKFDVLLSGEWCYAASTDYAKSNDLPPENNASSSSINPAAHLNNNRKKYTKLKPLDILGCRLENVLLVDTVPAKVIPEQRHRVRKISAWKPGMADDGALKQAVDAILAGDWNGTEKEVGAKKTRGFAPPGWYPEGAQIIEHEHELRVLPLRPFSDTKLYAILAAMGLGKTTRARRWMRQMDLLTDPLARKRLTRKIRKYIRVHNRAGPQQVDIRSLLHHAEKVAKKYGSALVISTRISLSLQQQSWFPGFAHYQSLGITFCEPRLILQYESLHHMAQAGVKPPDVIILDEVRSLCDNMACEETNGSRLQLNFQMFRALVQAAKLTICMDAHLEVDRCVPELLSSLFLPHQMEIHRYHQFIQNRTLKIGINESDFVERIKEALNSGQRVYIGCRTEPNAQCHARVLAEFNPFVVTSKTEDMSAFKNLNKFLKTRQLIISTSKMSVGCDITIPWDRAFFDFRGKSGASARNCVQMIGRFRKLKNTTVEVLSESKHGTPNPDLDKQIEEYVSLRKNVSNEHHLLISGSTQFVHGRLQYAPDCIGKIALWNLREQLEDKMIALKRVSAVEGWDTTYDEEDEPQVHSATKKARSDVRTETKKRDRAVFESVAKLEESERTELLSDYYSKVENRGRITTQEAESAAVAKILDDYVEPLGYEEFRVARSHGSVMARHETLRTPAPPSEQQICEQAHRQTRDWFDVFGKFDAIQQGRIEKALRLAGVPDVRSIGTEINMELLRTNAAEILQLMRESAAAGKRRWKSSKCKPEDEALVALRHELQCTLGMTLHSKQRRVGKHRIQVYIYQPLESIASLSQKRRKKLRTE